MAGRKRTVLWLEAERVSREQLARAGSDVRRSRKGRRLTQQALAQRVGLSRMAVSRAELGRGGGITMDAWQRLAVSLGCPMRIEFGRDPEDEPVDAGHLKTQELILRLGREAGYRGTFELATRPADPARSTDVGLRDDPHRRLVLVEVWNTFGDLGASARSSARKAAEAEQYAVAIGHGAAYTVHSCWVVRATKRNRALVARYPEILAARFPGSSRAWVNALTSGTEPPGEPGLVWADVRSGRLFPWRRRL
ncbi:MAG: helix-turn-helix domain-containing protein [Chloroflexi bacterium]|nr:helix-turn-helix domain-containing protein [Chloroflexota bacterium]